MSNYEDQLTSAFGQQSGSGTTPAPIDEDQMHVDKDTPGYNANPIIINPSSGAYPLNFSTTQLQGFGKMSELPATKAMKTRVKNLTSKHSRLQDRLLKYTGLVNFTNNMHTFKDEASAKAAKKFYQFRFVDIQSIRKTTLADVDRFIGVQAVSLLIGDVNADIDSVVTEVEAASGTLLAELTGYKQRALNCSLFSDKEKKIYEQWWSEQITYNISRLEMHIISCKGSATNAAVSDLIESLARKCRFIIDTTIPLISGTHQGEGSGP
ncbi:MAG TPA: hypothetical protein VM682_07275, partial [Bacillus sp. (in: firmicutes)]|nr:hypothetical protein [Bacillus sp. (in: firmicutes)]